VLLDECIDWRLGRELAGCEVKSAARIGWGGLKNGVLLGKAQAEFDVFVTTDRNLSFQQNLSRFDIAVIVLESPSNRLQDLIPLAPRLRTAISKVRPGPVIVLGP
jgi:hypothetical protein